MHHSSPLTSHSLHSFHPSCILYLSPSTGSIPLARYRLITSHPIHSTHLSHCYIYPSCLPCILTRSCLPYTLCLAHHRLHPNCLSQTQCLSLVIASTILSALHTPSPSIFSTLSPAILSNHLACHASSIPFSYTFIYSSHPPSILHPFSFAMHSPSLAIHLASFPPPIPSALHTPSRPVSSTLLLAIPSTHLARHSFYLSRPPCILYLYCPPFLLPISPAMHHPSLLTRHSLHSSLTMHYLFLAIHRRHSLHPSRLPLPLSLSPAMHTPSRFIFSTPLAHYVVKRVCLS